MRRIIVASIFFILAGCTTNKPLTALPESNDEYSLSVEELSEKYPDIPKYEKTWRGFKPNHPPEENIVEHLGEPDYKKRNWWYPIVMAGTLVVIGADPLFWGFILALRPNIPEIYYYEKGNHCIKIPMDRSIATKYQQRMISWEWLNKKECGS